jgi:hypothetical protein
LPAHHHHQTKTEKQECQAAQAILNPDHFVVGRENVFTPKSELVMLVCRVVHVRFVMGINGSRSVHFSRELTVVNIEEKPSLQSEKFRITPEND